MKREAGAADAAPMRKRGRLPLAASLKRDRYLYLLIVPALIWLLIFKYLPIYGITMAFQDFTLRKGYLGSPFAGYKHFLWLFNRESFMDAFWNTWITNILRIAVGFPAPLLLALLLNEVKSLRFKQAVQTLSYLPHFISWVVLAGIFNALLAKDSGAVNGLMAVIGLPRQDFLQSNQWFRWILVFTDVWKEVGWGTIIYLAAISAINPELYESALVDGAGRWRQMVSITLPLLASTMIVLLILRLGSVLNVGFEQVYNLYNPLVYETGDIIDTWVVRSLQSGSADFSRLAAAGLVKNLIGMVLLLAANRAVRLFGREGIY
jgi:putative aldouronate transport system permease protein